MDSFTAIRNSKCGVGGMQCTCCNDKTSTGKRCLNKQAKAIMKADLRKEIELENDGNTN